MESSIAGESVIKGIPNSSPESMNAGNDNMATRKKRNRNGSRKWQTDRELEIRRVRLLRLRRRADLCWPDSGEPKTANRPASDEPADRCRRDERVGPVRGGRD